MKLADAIKGLPRSRTGVLRLLRQYPNVKGAGLVRMFSCPLATHLRASGVKGVSVGPGEAHALEAEGPVRVALPEYVTEAIASLDKTAAWA